MARHATSKGGGTSRFRLVVIDAELQEGEISQLAQAIQGAFGAQRAPIARLNGPALNPPPSQNTIEIPGQSDGAEMHEDVAPVTAPASPVRPKAQRKLRTPNLDPDLHPGADPSLKAYAEARGVSPKASVLRKFLTVAAWLDEERSGLKITADRAYTCFRFIEWPFNIDFYQPLRDLQAKSKFLALKPEDKGKGEFSITHLGLNKAKEMRRGS